MIILIAFSILSGLVTVLSPCILPVLPIVLSSSAANGKARPVGVIIGLIVSFSLFTLAASWLVGLLGLSANALRLAAVALLALLGLGMIVPALNTLLEKVFGLLPGLVQPQRAAGSGFGPGLITGVGLGVVWAPCAGPILAAVTTLAATQKLSFGAAAVVLAYAFGAGLPLLAIAYGGRALIQRVPLLTRNLQRVQQGFGVAMLLTAALMAAGADTLVTTWLTNAVPATWTASLNSFESSPAVSQGLGQLKTGAAASTAAPAALDTPAPVGQAAMDLPNLGPAPDFTGITHWVNSQPLTLQALRGKVVLIDFWTYSCINCLRTLPYVTDWYNKYKDAGLVVVGVHSPEFAFEHETANVEAAVKQHAIAYPVAQDNDFATWQAYNNQYWPAEYFIDAQGNVRHTHFGEGQYDESEKVIQALLAEAGHPVQAALTQAPAVSFSSEETPETYIGSARQERFASPEAGNPGQLTYTYPTALPLHHFAVSGQWRFQPEFAQTSAPGDKLELHFYAKDVYLVMTSAQPAAVKVSLTSPDQANHSEDVDAQGQITVQASRLYHVVGLGASAEGTVMLQFNTPGTQVYAFTFGG